MELTLIAGWLAGLGIGLFILLHFWVIGKPVGCSTGYGNFVGFVSKIPYFHTGEYSQLNNWKLWFLLGIPLGGLTNLLLSGNPLQWTFDMGMYETILPSNDWAKGAWLLAGGFLLGLGARMAGACTTGHALVGCSLVNKPSIIAAALFFISALVSTQLLFKFLG
jgi:uncharacterized membrane protein YedE/YeeE